MAKSVFLNRAGVRQLLRSGEVADDLGRRAEAIEAAANAAAGEPGAFEWDVEVGSNRARASVRTASLDGMLAEAKDRALTRSFDAGRR
jgi:hypothetical protein